MSDTEDVLRANEDFYAAVEAGDLDRLRAQWAAGRDVVCVHPGAGPIHGLSAVMRSWALLLAGTPFVQFVLTDVEVSMSQDVAILTCTENMLTAGEAVGDFRGGQVSALNVFCRTSDGWRMWAHQAAPVGSAAHE